VATVICVALALAPGAPALLSSRHGAPSWLGVDADAAILHAGLLQAPHFSDTLRWWTGLWVGGAAAPFYRPLASLLFWCEWRAFGDREWLYLVPGLLAHVASTLLFAAFVSRLATRFGVRARAVAALAGAWIFTGLLSPIFMRQAVVAAVVWRWKNQPDSFAACFAFLSLLFYLRAQEGRRGALPGAIAAYLAACCFKEIAVPLPLVCLALELAERRQRSARPASSAPPGRGNQLARRSGARHAAPGYLPAPLRGESRPGGAPIERGRLVRLNFTRRFRGGPRPNEAPEGSPEPGTRSGPPLGGQDEARPVRPGGAAERSRGVLEMEELAGARAGQRVAWIAAAAAVFLIARYLSIRGLGYTYGLNREWLRRTLLELLGPFGPAVLGAWLGSAVAAWAAIVVLFYGRLRRQRRVEASVWPTLAAVSLLIAGWAAVGAAAVPPDFGAEAHGRSNLPTLATGLLLCLQPVAVENALAAGAMIIAVALLRKRSWPIVLLGLVWEAAFLAPLALSPGPTHRYYLPEAGYALVYALAAATAGERLHERLAAARRCAAGRDRDAR
jgi:hypothetical protein